MWSWDPITGLAECISLFTCTFVFEHRDVVYCRALRDEETQ